MVENALSLGLVGWRVPQPSAGHLAMSIAWQIACDCDPENEEADAGCVECTLWTVPKHRETGLCVYHAALEVLGWTEAHP